MLCLKTSLESGFPVTPIDFCVNSLPLQGKTLLTYDTGKHYILQKMNRSIFTKPVELMENVSGVTAWLKKKIQENGGDVERETLNLVMTKDGLPYYVDEDGEYWRVYLFIENATCYDMVKDEEDFYFYRPDLRRNRSAGCTKNRITKRGTISLHLFQMKKSGRS